MTDINAMLAAQRRLMWPLAPADREHRLAEVRADYEFEEHLRAVAFAMQEPRPEPKCGMMDAMIVQLCIWLGAAVIAVVMFA